MKTSSTSAYHSYLLAGLRLSYQDFARVSDLLEKFPTEVKELATLEIGKFAEFVSLREEKQVHRISVILFAASFLEAVINHWLVTSLSRDEFDAVERMSPLEKWTVASKLIEKKISFPKGRRPHQEMVELYTRRNDIMHHVPFHEIDGETIHKGKIPKVSHSEDLLTKKFFELPGRLMHHLIDSGFSSEAFDLITGSGMNLAEFIDKMNSKKKIEPVEVSNG